MARRGSNKRRTRDNTSIARPPLRSTSIANVIKNLEASARRNDEYLAKMRAVLDLEDRRRFDFERNKARASIRSASRLVVDNKREFDRRRIANERRNNIRWNVGPFHVRLFDRAPSVPEGVRFSVPRRVALCVRRRIRREVLHALKPEFLRGHGRGSKPRRKERAKWNEFSLIRC